MWLSPSELYTGRNAQGATSNLVKALVAMLVTGEERNHRGFVGAIASTAKSCDVKVAPARDSSGPGRIRLGGMTRGSIVEGTFFRRTDKQSGANIGRLSGANMPRIPSVRRSRRATYVATTIESCERADIKKLPRYEADAQELRERTKHLRALRLARDDAANANVGDEQG